MSSLDKVKIKRNIEAQTPMLIFLLRHLMRRIGFDMKSRTFPFIEYFEGFDRVEAVDRLFGDETEKVIAELRVEFVSGIGYMGVSGSDGHLIVSANYLKSGDLRDIYLDIIHELTHVKQFRSGYELFDLRYGYTDRPTEVEAYRYAVEEAKRIGMTDDEIFQYLKTEWMSKKDHRRLAESLGIKAR